MNRIAAHSGGFLIRKSFHSAAENDKNVSIWKYARMPPYFRFYGTLFRGGIVICLMPCKRI